MYIYGTYIPPLERASLSLILSSSHQAQNIIAKPLIAPSYNLSHIFLIFFTCAPLLSTAPLLCLSYCNPSCCPLASPVITEELTNEELITQKLPSQYNDFRDVFSK